MSRLHKDSIPVDHTVVDAIWFNSTTEGVSHWANIYFGRTPFTMSDARQLLRLINTERHRKRAAEPRFQERLKELRYYVFKNAIEIQNLWE